MKNIITLTAASVLASLIFANAGYAENLSLENVVAPSTEQVVAQNSRRTAPANRAKTRRARGERSSATPKATGRRKASGDAQLAKARQLAKAGQYQEAAKMLFQLSRSPSYQKQSVQIKYILGLMLYELKLNQSAAFVFYDVIKSESRRNPGSKYLKSSLEKLSLAADQLDSDVLLRYAIKKIREDDFPAAHRDMLYFRAGELRMGDKDYMGAASLFSKVRKGSVFYAKAKYKQGLSLAEAKKPEMALGSFEDLAAASSFGGVTDSNRVNSLLGKARVLYQKQDWDSAAEVYREIPRDTQQWHDSLFESSWAMLRSARFRSALSNFHSLHSPYYEDFYQPESLLLRGIVYLYICRYDEMEKTLDLFEKIYKPVQKDVRDALKSNRDPESLFRELSKIQSNFDEIRSGRQSKRSLGIPFVVARRMLNEGDIKKTMNYLENLKEEKRRISAMSSWGNSGIGKYASRIVERRIDATQKLAGKFIRRHLVQVNNELRDLFEQNGFLRFEMVSGKKEVVKKQIAGKGLEKQQIVEKSNRDFFIQNGYEYWPFTGEYWLDEIGNYHYVGVQACE